MKNRPDEFYYCNVVGGDYFILYSWKFSLFFLHGNVHMFLFFFTVPTKKDKKKSNKISVFKLYLEMLLVNGKVSTRTSGIDCGR